MGDDEEFSSTKDSIPSYAGDVESFFSFMLETLKSDTGKNVFILDYSDYLFGNANALSEQERANLLKLNKALQVQEYNLANQDFFENGNLVIILAKNQSTIPPEYYLNNPMVSTISVPLPGRNERERFILVLRNYFSIYTDWIFYC